ncbi:MAG: glutathione S-transferase N-terminal domain-containing protein [Pseudomonadota bacterium]|nr:glutathione S-transferase N-terminal domain-containing protein [Pseudomonadota bacterium]
MIDLYAMGSPNVVKIYIALEELELPYEVHPVDVFAGEQFEPAFLAVNPNAKVPAIVDRQGPGGKRYTLFESGAILLYLADKTGKLLPQETAARFEAIQWLMVQLTGVGPMFGQFVHFWRFAPPGNEYSLSRYRTQARRLCKVLEGRLATVPYLGGREYSVADIATFPWARNIGTYLDATPADYPNLFAWVEKIDVRPAVSRALAAVEQVRGKTTQFDRAEADGLDRMFGRGQFAQA